MKLSFVDYDMPFLKSNATFIYKLCYEICKNVIKQRYNYPQRLCGIDN